MIVIKRDGRKVDLDKDKIKNAILKAFEEVDGDVTTYSKDKAREIANYIESLNKDMSVEEIQDIVEEKLMASNRKDVARAYIIYRNERTRLRGNTTDKVIEEIVLDKDGYWKTENSNKNQKIVTTQRDYIAGATSTDLARRLILPKELVDAHDEGIIHIHDMDYLAQCALTNCELLNLEDMLQNGTVINGIMIEKPHRILTAATIATQIILAVTSSTYGGCTITLTHLAPFVRDSYNVYLKKYRDYGLDEATCIDLANKDTKKEIVDAVQTFNYQCNSMTNTNGQAPFLSVNMYLNESAEYKQEVAMLIEEFLKQRIQGFKNKQGVYITPAFPKLLYVLEEDNINENGKYYYLTKLAAECSAKRLVPDYISEKVMLKLKGDCYPCMGCRSFLTPSEDHKYYGRFNQGVVTINLPDVALSSGGDFDKFWDLFNERTELCHKALQIKHNRIASITSDAAPILWQHGAFARLKEGESVAPLLYGGYSTISLGYAGLYECVKYMTGQSHTDHSIGHDFGIQVMQALNDKCNKWKEEENIAYSLYGSPIESATYKFAKNLKRRFGEIPGITDRSYITNSYHVPVFEKIDAFSKLSIESEFQELSPGGAISYIETVNMSKNIDAIIAVIKFIYDNIMYAEINTRSDYCQVCGWDGEIEIIGENDNLHWECPQCHNTDTTKMNVARRTCGYIGTNFWNTGRTQEINERVTHL